jgi:hypothetical protein
MKQANISYFFIFHFLLITGILKAQSSEQLNTEINSIENLKIAIDSTSFQNVMSSFESWFPEVVSGTLWNTMVSQHFMIHYYIAHHDEDDILFDSLMIKSEEIYTDLIRFFEIEANSKQALLAQQTRLLCFIAKVDSKITFGFLNDPHTFFFYLDTKQTPEYLEKFRHEYAHWVWGRSYGEASSFLWEGLATYGEKMSNPESDISSLVGHGFDIGTIPPLKDCVKNEVFWSKKGMYTAGSLFIHYLVENWGWDRLKQLFHISDFEDPDIHEHFYQVYGIKLEDMDHDWKTFIKTQFERAALIP